MTEGGCSSGGRTAHLLMGRLMVRTLADVSISVDVRAQAQRRTSVNEACCIKASERSGRL